MHHIPFESSVKCGSTTEVVVAVQVAFLVAGCTHHTYYKTLKLALGIDAINPFVFMLIIVNVIKKMADEMCEEAKSDLKSMDLAQLGSWSRAVTAADGAWMTRGYHSKNAIFSMHNYITGALSTTSPVLYYKHLCQRSTVSLSSDLRTIS